MSTSRNQQQLEQALKAFAQNPTPSLSSAIARLRRAIKRETAAHAIKALPDLQTALEDIAKSEDADYMRGVARAALANLKGT